MTCYECNLDSDTNTKLKVYLYKDVQNIEGIHSNIVSGTWKCVVIKPSLIINPFQISVAANRSILAEKSNTLVTKTVYTEILYNLSISKNITQSLKAFGIEKSSAILICFLNSEEEENHIILKQIEGVQCPISDLETFTNVKDLKSVYKLNNIKCDVDLLDIIVSRMVTKGFVSF